MDTSTAATRSSRSSQSRHGYRRALTPTVTSSTGRHFSGGSSPTGVVTTEPHSPPTRPTSTGSAAAKRPREPDQAKTVHGQRRLVRIEPTEAIDLDPLQLFLKD